ncbi:MAG: hypothetical protein HW397_190 [Dehalococcoidia bacterium]|nr:hypothetical protein [Dehalococcoidia bacterium]
MILMDSKLKAAIIAAINAYVDEQKVAPSGIPDPRTNWLRQGRRQSLNAGQACFTRSRHW